MSRLDFETRHFEGLNPVSVDTGIVTSGAAFVDVAEFDTLGATVVGFIVDNLADNTVDAKIVGRNDHKGSVSGDWDYDDTNASVTAAAIGSSSLIFVTVKTTKVALQIKNGGGAAKVRAIGFKY